MGVYSWKYCDSTNRMICGKLKKSFLLIPKEFGGGHIAEHCYKGYGLIGNVDIYESVAEWNRKYLAIDMITVPDRNSWNNTQEGAYWYSLAIKRYEKECRMMQDFIEGKSDAYMQKTYDTDWKREIGILIACYDEDNFRLKYPIKIAEKAESVYESCNPSLQDPMQGCY